MAESDLHIQQGEVDSLVETIEELRDRIAELEEVLRCIYDLMGRHLGKDLVPLPKDRDIDNEDLWLALDEAGFGRIVISPELVRVRIISALGEPAAPGGGDDRD